MQLVTKLCLPCGRDFMYDADAARLCLEHCSNRCCQANRCDEARRDYRQEPPQGHCVVCHAPRRFFQRFAPCTEACKGRIWFASSKPDHRHSGDYSRIWMSACHLALDPELRDTHRPDRPARIHRLYCSLRCYNSAEAGHEARRRAGNRLRARRREGRKDGQDAQPGWRNRWRANQGYFKHYQELRRIRQAQSGGSGALFGTTGPSDRVNEARIEANAAIDAS